MGLLQLCFQLPDPFLTYWGELNVFEHEEGPYLRLETLVSKSKQTVNLALLLLKGMQNSCIVSLTGAQGHQQIGQEEMRRGCAPQGY